MEGSLKNGFCIPHFSIRISSSDFLKVTENQNKQPVTTIDSFEGSPGKARTTIASPNQPGKAHLQGSQQQTNPARAAGWLDGMMGIHKSS